MEAARRMSCLATHRIGVLAKKHCVQACKTSPLEEHYTLLIPCDARWTRNLDVNFGNRQSFDFVTKGETDHSLLLWNDGA